MKKITDILAKLSVFAICYLVIAFIGWSFDFRDWSWILRILLLFVIVGIVKPEVKNVIKI